MVKASFHKDVNYTLISEQEKKIKASRELFTIFYLTQNKGLTDEDIYLWAKKLGFSGYEGYSPDAIVRNNIYRWNDLAVSLVTGGTKCNTADCKKICSWGIEKNKPTKCERHKENNMKKVVEERLIKMKKEPGASKGKFYFDENFARRVFPNVVPHSTSSSSKMKVLEVPGTMNPVNMLLNPPKQIEENEETEEANPLTPSLASSLEL